MSHGNAEDGAAGGLPGVPNNRWGNNPFVYTTSEEEDGGEDGFSDSDLSDGDIFVEGLVSVSPVSQFVFRSVLS